MKRIRTPKDKVFDVGVSRPTGFNFDKSVASVFDDMLDRSVPYYKEMHRMSAEIAMNFAQPRTNIYDIGCSTGTMLVLLANAISNKSVKFIGLDNSPSMLEKCGEKLAQHKVANRCRLIDQDLNQGIEVRNASVVVMILTLQFVRPLHREKLLTDICAGMKKNGALIVIEKVLNTDSFLNSLYIELYYRYKERNGYSQTEITRKREALENVLIPYRLEENVELFKKCGFGAVETFFRWYNFCGILAVKK